MKHTILFVDDNKNIRLYCKRELEAEGYRVLLAQDGEDALAVVPELVPDLVIMDEHMPRCGGLEAGRHIKALFPDLPVILFTVDQDFDSYKSPFVQACLIKSEDLGPLKAAITSLLEARKRTEPPACELVVPDRRAPEMACDP